MTTAEGATRASSARVAWIAALVFAVACAVYAGSLANGFTYDDLYIVPNNPVVTGDGGLARIFSSSYWAPDDPHPHLYRPVTILSYWVQHRAAGAAPWSYHLVNVLLHGAISTLLLPVFLRLSGSAATAAAGALLFAVHPVHSEAVVSVVGRAELLAALFVVCAWLLRDRPVAAAACFALGMLSKENAAALPGLLLVEDAASRLRGAPGDGEPRHRPFLLYGLILLVALALVPLRSAVLGTVLGAPAGPFSETPVPHRLLTAFEVLGRYLWLMVFPETLSADYEFNQIPVVTSPLDAGFAAGLAAVAACAALAWWTWRRLPAASIGIAVFFMALAPVSNIPFGIGTVMAERLLYLPSAGLCLAAGALAAHLARNAAWLPRLRVEAAACLLAAVPALPLAVRCWTRTPDWRDQRTLFETTVRTSPRSTLAWLGLGYAYEKEGLLREAEMAYRRSVEIAPGRAVGHHNLGSVLMKLGRSTEAVREFEKALELQPTLWQACAPLGVLYQEAGRLREAEAAYRCAAGGSPRRARDHYNLATVLEAAGRPAEAIEQYEEALRLDAHDVASLNNLGRLLVEASRASEALPILERCAILAPGEARPLANLASARLQVGDRAGAREALRRVLQIDPGDPEAARMLRELETPHLP
jgi:Tfp pilus assembly protein PilF